MEAKMQKNEKSMSIEQMAELVALKKELLEVNEKLAKVKSVKTTKTPDKYEWYSKRGWTYKGDIKVSKTWTNKKTGITKTQDFDGVIFENAKGEQIKPLWVNNKSVLRIWN